MNIPTVGYVRKNFPPMYEVGMNIVRKGGLSGTLKKRA